jgi:hypothetical protein
VSAVDYAHLVGRYVSISRPKTDVDHPDDPDEVGGEGTVAMIHDTPDGVLICWDYGMGFTVTNDDAWSFGIWPDEDTRKLWRSHR